MKKFRNLLVLSFIFVLITNATTVNASNATNDSKTTILSPESEVEYLSDECDDPQLEGATIISIESKSDDKNSTVIKTYELKDGTKVVDTFTVSSTSGGSKSPAGTDSATRTRVISGWGTITMTASFTWYTDYSFPQISYVKCNSMSASYNVNSNVVVSTWDKDRDDKYKAFGKAYAWVDYYMYNSTNPTQHQGGTFKIYCSDNGTIGDNG